MAYSDSTNYSQTAKEVIIDALLMCHGLEDDEEPTASQLKLAMRALNRLVKAWSVKGLKAWCWNEASLTLAVGVAEYTLGPSGTPAMPRPLAIRNARKVIGADETEVRIASRAEYMNQTGKTSQGKPVFVFYDPQLDSGKLFVWPTPDAVDQLKFSYQQAIEDLDSQTNEPYFPSHWLQALVYGLASDLAPMYEVTGQDAMRIDMKAAQYLQEAEDADMEDGSVFIQPAYCY